MSSTPSPSYSQKALNYFAEDKKQNLYVKLEWQGKTVTKIHLGHTKYLKILKLWNKFTSFFSGKTTTMGNERTLDNVGIHLLKAEKLKTSFIQGFKDLASKVDEDKLKGKMVKLLNDEMKDNSIEDLEKQYAIDYARGGLVVVATEVTVNGKTIKLTKPGQLETLKKEFELPKENAFYKASLLALTQATSNALERESTIGAVEIASKVSHRVGFTTGGKPQEGNFKAFTNHAFPKKYRPDGASTLISIEIKTDEDTMQSISMKHQQLHVLGYQVPGKLSGTSGDFTQGVLHTNELEFTPGDGDDLSVSLKSRQKHYLENVDRDLAPHMLPSAAKGV